MARETDSPPTLTRRQAVRILSVGPATALAAAAIARSFRVSGSSVPEFPKGAVIRTVLNDLPPESLGNAATLFHEHLSFEFARVTGHRDRPGPEKDVALEASALNEAAGQGVGCIVDAGTRDVGRDIQFLCKIARQTRVHIVSGAGWYMQRTYPADFVTKSEDEIADDIVMAALEDRSGALGEIGETPNAPMSDLERKFFRAVGKAHIKTGLPIFTHNAYGTGPNVPRDAGLHQLDVLESAGVIPAHIAIGHMCCLDDPQAKIIKRIAKRGAFVGIDRVTGGFVPDDEKVAMVKAFLDAGHEKQLLLSSDYNFTARSEKRPGYANTLTVFVPKLRAAGIPDDALHRILYDNPRRFLAFIPKIKEPPPDDARYLREVSNTIAKL